MYKILLIIEKLKLNRKCLRRRVNLGEDTLLEPVAGELFDLVVSNPPFVITPRVAGESAEEQFTYRDGGPPGGLPPEDKLQAELDKLKDTHLRLVAEYDNYRKRTLKEKSELIRSGGEKALTDLLPVVDDLDIALQHISDRMLRAMRRRVTKAETYELLHDIRQSVPGIHLRTTLMTGHPQETEEDFEELIQFVQDIRFERMGAFVYSHESGTYAYDQYEDHIPLAVLLHLRLIIQYILVFLHLFS